MKPLYSINLFYNTMSSMNHEALNTRDFLINLLHEFLTKNLELSTPIEQVEQMLGRPPQFSMGHFALGCFRISKDLKGPPPKAAQIICEKWSHSEIEVKAQGPYANFTFSKELLFSLNAKSTLSGKMFSPNRLDQEKYMVEYSQPNTHIIR